MSFGPAGDRRFPGSGGPRGPQKPFKKMWGFAPYIFEWVVRPPGPKRPPAQNSCIKNPGVVFVLGLTTKNNNKKQQTTTKNNNHTNKQQTTTTTTNNNNLVEFWAPLCGRSQRPGMLLFLLRSAPKCSKIIFSFNNLRKQ